MSIIAVLTDPAKGGNFLSWSLHYLAGHTTYYCAKTQCWTELIQNPIAEKNAHKFVANQVSSYKQFRHYMDMLAACKSDNFHVLYFHNFRETPMIPQSDFPETRKSIQEIFNEASQKIVLTNQAKYCLYEKSYRTRHGMWSDREDLDNYIDEYFRDNYQAWQRAGLDSIWDLREFLALNFRHDTVSISPLIDLSLDHVAIDCMEWLNIGDHILPNLLEQINITVDCDRFSSWVPIYQQWRKVHYQRLNFLWCFDKIINYIVCGYYMDLTRFDLDVVQEAAIQHELIYKYNLNFKTFQLEKFIDTSQLHSLLEENIHDLTLRQ